MIAAESATNSREGGALVPTVVFGVPSSAWMAILLGAFLIHGLVPGPDMVTKNLDITYSMVGASRSPTYLVPVCAFCCLANSRSWQRYATLSFSPACCVSFTSAHLRASENGVISTLCCFLGCLAGPLNISNGRVRRWSSASSSAACWNATCSFQFSATGVPGSRARL